MAPLPLITCPEAPELVFANTDVPPAPTTSARTSGLLATTAYYCLGELLRYSFGSLHAHVLAG